MFIIAGLLAAAAASAADDSLYYRAPESSSAADLAQAAQALARRSQNFGYKGVEAAVVKRDGRMVVQLSCEGGLTPEMKGVLNAFGRMSGSSVELRFPSVPNDVVRDQVRPGLRPSEDRAPAGTKWIRFRNPDEAPVLVRDELAVSRGEIRMRSIRDRSGSPRVFWDISQLRSREIQEADRKARLGSPYLVMDGWAIEAVALNTLERNEEGQIVPAARLYFAPMSRIVQEALANPMPLTLVNEEEAEGP
ncbi:MAG TPA: hypothetical protein VMU54_25450 [Planctomycetota bacterium]|nr:hypothetical protein [Planctomycetota bacterium]